MQFMIAESAEYLASLTEADALALIRRVVAEAEQNPAKEAMQYAANLWVAFDPRSPVEEDASNELFDVLGRSAYKKSLAA